MLVVILLVIGVGLLVMYAVSYAYKNEEKVDQGFTLNYHRLSYRRKFIRTFWMTPFIIFTIFFIFMLSTWGVAIDILIISMLIISHVFQLIYTYIKWKRSESEEHELHHE
ncbi:hypothetical protein [Geomicrobium sp. JCM 19055]|uniref:hypothetical protein n=1 Tax=Geomicrobium sp. JCM 19055 TaxID=1460649 RepID=UPI0005A8D4CF|nr:hypothetical protein [Geomicrobium sp. JCM 19055]